jgi:hypothetical protein
MLISSLEWEHLYILAVHRYAPLYGTFRPKRDSPVSNKEDGWVYH